MPRLLLFAVLSCLASTGCYCSSSHGFGCPMGVSAAVAPAAPQLAYAAVAQPQLTYATIAQPQVQTVAVYSQPAPQPVMALQMAPEAPAVRYAIVAQPQQTYGSAPLCVAPAPPSCAAPR